MSAVLHSSHQWQWYLGLKTCCIFFLTIEWRQLEVYKQISNHYNLLHSILGCGKDTYLSINLSCIYGFNIIKNFAYWFFGNDYKIICHCLFPKELKGMGLVIRKIHIACFAANCWIKKIIWESRNWKKIYLFQIKFTDFSIDFQLIKKFYNL